MINRAFVLYLLCFLRSAVAVVAQPDLDTAFKQADKIYQNNIAAGFKAFQAVYTQALKSHDKVIEVRCLNLFTEYYWTLRDPRRAMDWGLKSISMAESYQTDGLAGDACVLTGLVCYSDGRYQDAIHYYQRGVAHYQKQPAGQRIGLAYMNLGVAERKLSRFETANTYYFKAAEIFQQLGNQSYLASVYTAIGNSYAAMDNYQQAVIYQQRSLVLFKALHNPLAEAQALNNLGFAYMQLHRPDPAMSALTTAVRLYTASKDSSTLVNPYQNLGSCWKQKGDLAKAIRYIQRALSIAENYHMAEETARGKADLARYRMAQGRYPEAFKLLGDAKFTAVQLKLTDLQVTLAELNYQLQAALGHDREALAFYRQRDLIRDSLLTETKSRAIEDLEVHYQTREKERDIIDLHIRDKASQKLLGEQRFSIIALISAAVLLLALLALAFYSFRRQRQQNRVIRSLNKEINHRTKNNLQILSSLLMLQIEQQENEQVKSALKETEVRLQAMNIMYGKLYTGQEHTNVDMSVYVHSLLAHIKDGFDHAKRRVTVEEDLDQVILPTDKAVLLGLLLNEISTNSMRHSSPAGGLTLTVSLKMLDNKTVELAIRDNGKPKKTRSKAGGNSFGLRIVGLIVNQLNGTMTMEPENPYAYRIQFKK